MVTFLRELVQRRSPFSGSKVTFVRVADPTKGHLFPGNLRKAANMSGQKRQLRSQVGLDICLAGKSDSDASLSDLAAPTCLRPNSLNERSPFSGVAFWRAELRPLAENRQSGSFGDNGSCTLPALIEPKRGCGRLWVRVVS